MRYNEAHHDIWHHTLDIGRPIYTNLNWLYAHTICALVASLCCDGDLNVTSLSSRRNSVVMHFVHCSCTLVTN